MLSEKPIKVGAKAASHSRYVILRMGEFAGLLPMFHEFLSRVAQLHAPPVPA